MPRQKLADPSSQWWGSMEVNMGGVTYLSRDFPLGLNIKSAEDPAVFATKSRQRAIAQGLRRLYDVVVEEPIPEDFLDLLRQADDVARKRNAN